MGGVFGEISFLPPIQGILLKVLFALPSHCVVSGLGFVGTKTHKPEPKAVRAIKPRSDEKSKPEAALLNKKLQCSSVVFDHFLQFWLNRFPANRLSLRKPVFQFQLTTRTV